MVEIFDFEVLRYDWIVVFRDKQTKEFFTYHNDNTGVASHLKTRKPLLAGFNNKGYDRYILKAVLAGFSPEDIKAVNDYIIGGGNGWECPMLRDVRINYPQYDLMDDMQSGLSLKSIEAHLGMNIVESSIDFNVDHKLDDAELNELITYCKYDVEATDRLDDLRRDYLANKVAVGKECGLSKAQAVSLTNAKLTAKYLGAVRQRFDDERIYTPPITLNKKYIPDTVWDFFGRLRDSAIADEDVFSGTCEFNIYECKCTLGFGGIHGAIPQYKETATDKRVIRNVDVASYYPHQMVINGFTSRAIHDAGKYADIIKRRVEAKRNGDKATANALKLVLNTTYGAMLNKYNDLYDAKMGRSVCISGQLQLLELACHLVDDCPTLKIIQLNTDGIMVSFDLSDESAYKGIIEEWQSRTGFELEEDSIQSVVQKDVNNYAEMQTDGTAKLKGGMLVRGISPAGAFNINNNAVIVAHAVALRLCKDIPVEKTICECDNINGYQLIAKASGKYKSVLHDIDGTMRKVQKCNRVYASNDPHNGTLYKVGKDGGKPEKIAGLPMSCIIDNDNHCTMEEIDKEWYINLANKQVDMFLGNTDPVGNAREINKLKRKALDLWQM